MVQYKIQFLAQLTLKLKIFFVLFTMIVSIGTTFAKSVQIGNLYYNLDSQNLTAEVTSQNYSEPFWSTEITSANIPSTVNFNDVIYTVTRIGDYAFYGCANLTSITIPNTVQSIGFAAFYCCSFSSIEIPNSVTTIGSAAFSCCFNLTSVTLPNAITTIECFYKCTGLISVTIPNSVTLIGTSAFHGCTSLASIEIPNSVTRIFDYAFYDCPALISITIPNSVTRIGQYAFDGCTGLTSVVLGNGVTNISSYAFAHCSGLASITCKAITPPELPNTAFNGVNKYSPLYVPAESRDTYRITNGWKEFYNIQSIQSETSVETSYENNSIEGKYLHNGQILILRGDKTYTLTGQVVQ